MNSKLYELRDLLDDHDVGFPYSDLIDEIDEEIEELEDNQKDCEWCEKFEGFVDPDLLHRDFQQLEVQHELKQISDEAYLVAKAILEKYTTI